VHKFYDGLLTLYIFSPSSSTLECKSAAIDFLSCFFPEREIQTINNKELKLFCKNSKNKIYEIRQQFHHVIIQMGNNIYCGLVNFSSYTSRTNRKIYFFSPLLHLLPWAWCVGERWDQRMIREDSIKKFSVKSAW